MTPPKRIPPSDEENLYAAALADLLAKRADIDAAIAALYRVMGAEAPALPGVAPTALPAPHPRPRALRRYATPALTPEVIATIEGDQERAIAKAVAGAGDAGIMLQEIAELTGIKRQSISTPLNSFLRRGLIRQEPTTPLKADRAPVADDDDDDDTGTEQ